MQKKLCFVLCLCLWRCLTIVDACRSKSSLFGENKSTPEKVHYSESGQLNVALELLNVPIEVTSYIIAKKQFYQPYDVVKSGDNLPAKNYTRGEKRSLFLPFNVILEKSNSHTIYKVFLKANDVYCNRKLNPEFLQIVYTEKQQFAPAADQEDFINLTVTPQKFRKDQRFVEFTCSAFCFSDEILVWFQDKNLPDFTVLLVNHTYHKYLTSSRKLTQVKLRKTLDDADRGTAIFCGVRTVITGTENETLNLSIPSYAANGVTSEKIDIMFDREIKTDKPNVTIEPSGDVFFEPNSTMEFVCRSTMVDDRTLSWYEEDLNSISRYLPSNQSLTGTAMTSALKLHVNESHVSKSIYCAQEYRLVYRIGREVYNFRYGVIARSEPIRLRRKETDTRTESERISSEQPAENDTRTRNAIAGACVVGSVVLLLAGLWVSRFWYRQNSQDEEDDYVVPQITYAVLALPETNSKPPNKPKKQNYVEIVGVFKNKTKK